MIKSHKRGLESLTRADKSFIAIVLLAIVIGLSLLVFAGKSGVTSNVVVDSNMDSVAQNYITSDEYYIKYQGYDLKLDSVTESPQGHFVLTYDYKINTPLLVKSIKGFTAIIEVENNAVTAARYIRI